MRVFIVLQQVYISFCSWLLNRLRENISGHVYLFWNVMKIADLQQWKMHVTTFFVHHFKISKFLSSLTQCVEKSLPHTWMSRWHLLSYCTASGCWSMWIPCCVFKLSSGPGKMSHISVMSHRYDLIPIPYASKCWPCTKEKVAVS